MFTNCARRVYLAVVIAIGAALAVACAPSGATEPAAAPVLTEVPETMEVTQGPENEIQEVSVPWPSPRIHPSMFYEPATERIFMFSGMSGMQRNVDLNEVWTYDSASGSWQLMGEMAPKDTLISFGFDEESRRVVGLNNLPRKTWAYDLETGAWEEQQPSEQPSEDPPLGRRFGAGMSYDAESDRLIFFGGGAPEKLFSDTWAYDYNTDTWEEMLPSSSPSPRAMFQMAYDSESDRVILWGGFMEPEVEDVLMWAYDYNSNTWEAFENADGPQQHWERGSMVYIPELDQMLVFTGMREYEDVLVGPETWYYDYNTNSWTKIEIETSPPQLAMYAMVYDPATGKVVLFGGERSSKYAGDISNDVWLFDPGEENWSQLKAPTPVQK
jgi:hypothetical protein